MTRKVIAFSLYGNHQRYDAGAVENAKAASDFYPGWEVWIYCADDTTPTVQEALRRAGAKVILQPPAAGLIASTWRFAALSHPEVAVFVSRDCDSRFSRRETSAVQQWLSSGKTLHAMRDSIFHGAVILAGMFGVRCDLFRQRYPAFDLAAELRSFSGSLERYGDDQKFLRHALWPLLERDHLAHDHHRLFATGSEVDFPEPSWEAATFFVGQQVDERNLPVFHPGLRQEIKARKLFRPSRLQLCRALSVARRLHLPARMANVLFAQLLESELRAKRTTMRS